MKITYSNLYIGRKYSKARVVSHSGKYHRFPLIYKDDLFT